MNISEFNRSLWLDKIKLVEGLNLANDTEADVVIIGGGIVGISTAYHLCKSGKSILLLDQGIPCTGTTGYTTAKITSQHGLIYKSLVDDYGMKVAREYAESNELAISMVENIITQNKIDCDFYKETAYVYTKNEKYLKKITEEAKITNQLGIKSFYTEETPLFKNILGAIGFKNQAIFHPLKYLQALLNISIKNGVMLYQGHIAINIEEGNPCKIILDNGTKIKASFAVIASHYPFYEGNGLYFSRIYPYRSYAIAIKVKDEYPGGMYLSAEEPIRSIRSYNSKENNIVIIGGENHKTGHKRNGDKEAEETGEKIYFERLEQFAAEYFNVEKYLYQWSTQDYVTMDKLPYIGRLSEKNENIFIATGFDKWGMTKGTLSGKIISNLIIDGQSQWENLYTPTRFTPLQSSGKFITENANVAASLIQGKLEEALNDYPLKPNEAKVIQIDTEKFGVYCDEESTLHYVKNTCTHLGCSLKWNNAERSWDCPCHGSRFDYHGNIINSPALEKISFWEETNL